MSFLDLATLALHRRNEMEARIHVFMSKCDLAISDITRLKTQAQNFVLDLNCEPDQLKERFLRCMRQLDEYIYLVTDFNLSINKLEGTNNVDVTPVQGLKVLPPIMPNSFNLMDTLSEPAPTTQLSMCLNNCRVEKPFVKKVPKAEQVLIQFSSASTSSESVPQLKNKVAKENTDMKESCLCRKDVAAASKTAEAETQCQLGTKMQMLKMSSPDDQQSDEEEEAVTLPGQDVLPADRSYPALIMNADSGSFWVITDDIDETYRLMLEMTTYYKLNTVEMAPEEIIAPCYYAFYDIESDCFYRGLLIRLDEDGTAEVFLVDTGEVRGGDARSCLQPLAPRFAAKPPYARFCHLAGVELINLDCEVQLEKFENFMRKYIGLNVTIEVDDNTSESLGVYVVLKDNTILNNLVVQQGLAIDISGKSAASAAQIPLPKYIPPERKLKSEEELDLDITNCPEYDDAVEAVMGYKCRDDAEICKHYKGGPDKTCFKGNHCKKRHVLKHPDGWTLDRQEVTGKVPPAVLPPPGAERRALVTCVPHFDHVFLQFLDNDTQECSLPSFGVVLPPMSLEALVRDMNSPAAVHSYETLTLPPAPGELVAALYPPDRQWYRARVLSLQRADQTVEVMYIDYGNVSWVREDEVRALHRRYTALPVCAARAALAGVVPKPGAAATDPAHAAKATAHLAALALDKRLDVVVVGRDYDEITVVLYDEEGCNIAEHLEAMQLLKLESYTFMDDSNVPQKHVIP